MSIPSVYALPPANALSTVAPKQKADFSPEKHHKAYLRQGVVSAGYALSITGNIALLLYPLLNRKAKPILRFLQTKIGPESTRQLLSAKTMKKLEETLPDKSKLLTRLWGILGVGFLLQMPMNYKTSLNAKQPSMLMCDLLSTLSTFCQVFSGNVVFRAMTVTADIFHRAGKYNDIENSNHLNQRREWDIHRLTRFMGGRTPAYLKNDTRSFTQEFGSASHFVAKDFRQVFSLKPWRHFIQNFNKKENWTIPNASMTALAGQFALFAGALTVLARFKSFEKIKDMLQYTAMGGIVVHDVMFQAPIMARGWENRHDRDGKLILASTPVHMMGSPFFLSDKLLFLNSFAGLANPFWAKGLNLNSAHRLATVDYIRKIQAQATQNPAITAQDILQYLQTNPAARQTMRKEMGEYGIQFILQTLQKAEQDRLEKNIPLATALHPITQSST